MSAVFPQFTTTERDALGTALATGLVIWNTTVTCHQKWNGSAWLDLGTPQAQSVIDATLTIGAEAGNAIPISIQFKDQNGTNFTSRVVFDVSLFDDAAYTTASTAADQNLTVTADGAAQEGSGDVIMTAISSATGACTISVNDATGALAGSRYLIILPASLPGSSSVVLPITQTATVTFA